jgi:16S rRNA (cytosine967-C5)-methyltransferase
LRQSNSPGEGAVDEREARVRVTAKADSSLRRRILSTFEAAARDWLHAAEVIARSQREARELHSSERRFMGDVVYELIRFRARLAFVAKSEAPAALLDAFLDGAAEGKIISVVEPVGAISIETSAPAWLVTRLASSFGISEARELLNAMNHRAPLSVRANRIKCDREKLAARLKEDGIESEFSSLARDGLRLLTRRNVYEMAAFRDGWMELQDQASQLCAELVAPPPRGTVVDACAGAGGKTLALGALLQNRGRITAFDVRGHALEELMRRARRAGLTNLRAIEISDGIPENVAPADRVLVDSPCSGMGVLRRHPETKWRVQESDLVELPKKQQGILTRYSSLVKPGGRLIYATCSIFPEENDQVVDAFLAAHPEFEPVSAKEILGKERALQIGDGERLRLFPHRHDTDGFFAAVMRRTAK